MREPGRVLAITTPTTREVEIMRTITKLVLFLTLLLVLAGTVQAYTYTTWTGEATHDGYVTRMGNFTWGGLSRGDGTDATNSPPSGDLLAGVTSGARSGYYNKSDRTVLTFDTSTIPEDAVILLAEVTVWGTAKTNTLGSANASLIDYTPVDPVAVLSSDDFVLTTFTRLAPDLEYADWNTDNINGFHLNDAGLAAIDTEGYTTVMISNNFTVDNSSPVWSASNSSSFSSAPVSSTSKPYLTVEYRTGTAMSGSVGSTCGGGANILAALNMAGLLIVVTGVGGLIYSLMSMGGYAGGGGSRYGRGTTDFNSKLLVASISAIMVGSVLLILTYVMLNAIIVTTGIG